MDVDATQILDFTDDDETDGELLSPQHRQPASAVSFEVTMEILVIVFLFLTSMTFVVKRIMAVVTEQYNLVLFKVY